MKDSIKFDTIEDEKLRIKQKQKLIKVKEKKFREKGFVEVGRLGFQADIHGLDPKILLGAFIEIHEKSKNESDLKNWSLIAEEWLEKKNKNKQTPLSISITESISSQLKTELKNLQFKWNSFRGEYYGYGNKEEIESVLNKFQISFKIEVLE